MQWHWGARRSLFTDNSYLLQSTEDIIQAGEGRGRLQAEPRKCIREAGWVQHRRAAAANTGERYLLFVWVED